MLELLVQPQNPLDLRPEDLSGLVSTLKGTETNTNVQLAYFNNEAVGVTLHEVLAIWVLSTPVTVPTLNKIIGLCLDALAEHFKKHPNRPHTVTIYGADGMPLKQVTQKRLELPPEETLLDANDPPRNRPPVR